MVVYQLPMIKNHDGHDIQLSIVPTIVPAMADVKSLIDPVFGGDSYYPLWSMICQHIKVVQMSVDDRDAQAIPKSKW